MPAKQASSAPHVPAAMKSAGMEVAAARGHYRQIRRIFNHSPVPMKLVDNERRVLAANLACRLLLRRTQAQMEGRLLDELVSSSGHRALLAEWGELMRAGRVLGFQTLTFRDGSQLRIVYCAVKDMLPYAHLVVGMPADWPDDELWTREDHAPDAADNQGVTRREREILALAALGADVNEIAEELTLATATVKTHLRNDYKKLGARNRAHAVAIALQRDMLDPP